MSRSASNELRRRASTRLVARFVASIGSDATSDSPLSLMWRGSCPRFSSKRRDSASTISRISVRPSGLSMMLASKTASQPVRPCSNASRSGPAGSARTGAQLFARVGELGRVGDEFLVGALGAGEALVVIARGHVRRPEEIFFRLVDGQIGVVQVVEVVACSLHGEYFILPRPTGTPFHLAGFRICVNRSTARPQSTPAH